MKHKRRRFLVLRFQYLFAVYQTAYLTLLGAAGFWVLLPLMRTVGDARGGFEKRELGAQILLFLDRRAMPVLVLVALVIFLHSIRTSHRVAGPLFRFRALLRSMAGGDLSMRVRIRPGDYLQEEARTFDQALAGLRERLGEIRERSLGLERELADLADRAPGGLRADLERLRDESRALVERWRTLRIDAGEAGRDEPETDAAREEAA